MSDDTVAFDAEVFFRNRAPRETQDGQEAENFSEEAFQDEENVPYGEAGEEVELEPQDDEEPQEKRHATNVFANIRLPKIKLPPKSDKPSIFSRLLDFYMEPIVRQRNPEAELTEDGKRRRRKPSKAQIFKEVYLPPVIAGLALVLVLSFIFGSVTNAIKVYKADKEQQTQESVAASEAANEEEQQFNQLLVDAERLAQGYDYQGAVDLLDSFTGDKADYQQQINAKKSEYVNLQASLVEWKDISTIPNLSFHVLINDPVRAFADTEFGGQYNKNFVTVEEFGKILNQLYSGGYVLVDYNSIVADNAGLDGKQSYFPNSLMLPSGKKPVMLTETMVNYFEYMVDGNKDHVADAGGAGFANKLVVDGNGDIKAEYIDINSNTMVGDYDFVPVLESFIKEHPDFSYRGARATLAVTGSEGIFGYRTNTIYVSQVNQEFYDKEVAQARVLVDALREKGYTLASYTYSNQDYAQKSVNEIKTECQNWQSQVVPVLGNVDTIVFARGKDIGDYTGAAGSKFSVLYEAGFRFFVGSASTPVTDVNTTFVHQSRIMVTGTAMFWNQKTFEGLFDCNVILDMANRKNVPKD